MCSIHGCEGTAALVLEIQGIELAHRYAKIFRAYHMSLKSHTPQLLEYGLKQDVQSRLRENVSPYLSTTISFETVYKALLGGDGRQLLPPTPRLCWNTEMAYVRLQSTRRKFQPDWQYLGFEEDPFEEAVRQGSKGTGATQYLSNLWDHGAKSEPQSL